MVDRTKAPEILQIDKLTLPEHRLHTLDNGIPVYEINLGTQKVVKMEIIFRAGRPYEDRPLVARSVAAQIKEGTKSFSGPEIAEQVDFFGATLSLPFNLDTSNVILYSLNRHFKSLMPIIESILKEAIFPEKELQAFIQRSIQRLQFDLSKNEVVAYRTITEQIFGSSHPYGYNSNPAMYQGLKREFLEQFYKEKFVAENITIILSGRTTSEHIDLLNEYLGQKMTSGKLSTPTFEPSIDTPKKIEIDHQDKVQTAIRIGKRLFNRHHPDFSGMYVLNTILGGYFGSRLMANIREDKGFTYNIFSSVDAMHFDGFFYVGTEVGNEFTEKTLEEIWKEIDLLRQHPVGREELEMVRNYLMGNFLTMIDGPFHVADIIKTQVVDKLPADYFENLVQTVREISADDLLNLAQKYLDPKDMWTVVVGSKN